MTASSQAFEEVKAGKCCLLGVFFFHLTNLEDIWHFGTSVTFHTHTHSSLLLLCSVLTFRMGWEELSSS